MQALLRPRELPLGEVRFGARANLRYRNADQLLAAPMLRQ